MKLFLLRHASALDHADDDLRELSPRGRREALALGGALAQRADFDPPTIWHSSLVRARETAELVVEGLGRAIPLERIEGLRPEDDPEVIVERANTVRRDLAIVGHEPHLGTLGALLVHGRGHPLAFPKACGYLLEPKGGDSPLWKIAAKIHPLEG